jgi:hypothetical protein
VIIGLTTAEPRADTRPPDVPECTGEWRGRRPDLNAIRRGEVRSLCGADFAGAALDDIQLNAVNLSGANLSGARLRRAILSDVEMSRANLNGADLTAATLITVRMIDAAAPAAVFTNAVVSASDLRRAYLREATFAGASLLQTDLSGASLDDADLCSTYFEPKTLPDVQGVAVARNLWSVRYFTWPGALASLREQLKTNGLRNQEREITFALNRLRSMRAWYSADEARSDASPIPCVPTGLVPAAPDVFRPSRSTLEDKVESVFSFVMFDLTCAYGLYPGRPLRIIVVLLVAFMIPYLIAVNRYTGGGIWVVKLADRVGKRKVKGDPMVRLTVRRLSRKPNRDLTTGRYVWVPMRIGFRLFRIVLYFSVLSTFSIGWRELNVGTWLTRVQRREYTLRPTGWVRTVSGLQAIVSMYLVALWALTYFGRPFE